MAKFAQIGQLATGIIHDINNATTSVRLNAELLLEALPRLAVMPLPDTADARDAKKLLRDVQAIVQDLLAGATLTASITQSLNALAHSASDRPEETDLHACIEVALRVGAHELGSRVAVERDFGTLPPFVGYPGLLVQVFLNLFINAAQAIEGAGVLHIRTCCEADDVVVEVRDTGRGITPSNLACILRPFFTTKPLGVGIGLNICKRIVDHHGGKLDISSSPSRGTTVQIRLPAEARQQASAPPTGGGPCGSDPGLTADGAS